MRRKEGDKGTSILDAATRVFAREGFDRAQISAIAAEAGIGTGSVYLYFPGKDAILDGIFERLWTRVLEAVRALPPAPPRERLEAHMGALVDALVHDHALIAVYLREAHRHGARVDAPGTVEREAALALGEETYREGVAVGAFRGGIPLGLARSIMFGGVRSALAWWIEPLSSLRRPEDDDPDGLRDDPDRFRAMAVRLAIAMLLPDGTLVPKRQESRP